jgi:hypothetical protein
MDILWHIAIYILGVNAVTLAIILFWYFIIGCHQESIVYFEEFVSYLFNTGEVADPYILRDGKWVKTHNASHIIFPYNLLS